MVQNSGILLLLYRVAVEDGLPLKTLFASIAFLDDAITDAAGRNATSRDPKEITATGGKSQVESADRLWPTRQNILIIVLFGVIFINAVVFVSP
jgi:hypothetical protein